jgi:uncharacterized protein YyaL (SSP411 family)
MKRAVPFVIAITILVPSALSATESSGGDPIPWTGWSSDLFEKAARENRLVLLDLEAVWCHWCHVMAETSYRDPAVVRLVREHFLPVRVDQDARPDLSNRYQDFGWPATVIFDTSGKELVTFAGYIPPARMANLLQGVVDDPTPGPSVLKQAALQAAEAPFLPPELRKTLEELAVSRYDTTHGGWGFVHKYLTADSVEYSLLRARSGDPESEKRARETLDLSRKLLDPVWGGIYQYSDGGVWENPHFEKIMSLQAEGLRTYALAYAQWHNPADLRSALEIHRFLKGFLGSPEGAFYTSQDADRVPGEHAAEYFALPDAARRHGGIPKVDTHLYARENAWAGGALLALYDVTGDEAVLDEALRDAQWLVAHRLRGDGGFNHDSADSAGPYLGDTLAAGRFFLGLYSATADRNWLARAEHAAQFIDKEFRIDVGFRTARPAGARERATPERDENTVLARFTNLLAEYTGQHEYREMAEHAMRYLAAPEVAKRFETGGILVADEEVRSSPLHITVVGRRDDPAARDLLKAALASAEPFKRVELWDPREAPLPRPDTDFPKLGTSAAYLCAQGRCSAPAKTPEALRERLARLNAASHPSF